MKYSLCKLVEILENSGYMVVGSFDNEFVLVVKGDCAPIKFWERAEALNGWIFQIGKNQVTDIKDAMKFSKKNITR